MVLWAVMERVLLQPVTLATRAPARDTRKLTQRRGSRHRGVRECI
jgi:hypothetical protein